MLINLVVPNYHSKTGRDLLLLDDSKVMDLSESILCIMSRPFSTYMRGLENFQHRTAIAMIDHDLLVPFSTASIRSHNPWIKEQYRMKMGKSVFTIHARMTTILCFLSFNLICFMMLLCKNIV